MVRCLLATGLAAALVLPGPAQALAGTEDDIVVRAIAPASPEQRRAVVRFVDRVVVQNEADQAARRGRAFCPVVRGLDDRYVDLVLQAIRQAAAATRRLAEAPAGCRPNLAVVFTTDGDALARAIVARQPTLLQGGDAALRRAWLGSGRAVRRWYGVNITTTDGMPIIDGVMRTYRSSLISTQVKLDLAATLVVVDVTRAEGLPLDGLAGYVAMASFAQVRPDGAIDSKAPSILGLFDRTVPQAAAQHGLTDWDRAYLRALYAIPLDRPLWQQRRALAGQMVRALQEPEAAPAP